MKITIAGAGRVGTHLAKYLSGEQQEITVVDADMDRLTGLDSDFNLLTVCGSPLSFATLREAGAGESDLFVAVTPVGAENIVACATAKSMGAKLTVARVDNFDYIDRENASVVGGMGVDKAVFPEYLAADAIARALEHSWAGHWHEFYRGKIVMAAVTVDADAPITRLPLKDIDAGGELYVSAVRRDHTTLIPRGDFQARAGDIIYFTATAGEIDKARIITAKTERNIRNVILAGGNLIAELLANMAASRFHFTIIEKDAARCRELARNCPKATVICGDAGDTETLFEAGVARADAFVALSDGAAGNIIACMSAADGGIIKTVAEIEREQLIPKAEAFGIDAIINKQLIASAAIFQLIVDSGVNSTKCLVLPDADVVRKEIREESELTRVCVKDLRLPAEITFAGMIRDGKGCRVTGATRLRPGDNVLVFCLDGALRKVEKLFGK